MILSPAAIAEVRELLTVGESDGRALSALTEPLRLGLWSLDVATDRAMARSGLVQLAARLPNAEETVAAVFACQPNCELPGSGSSPPGCEKLANVGTQQSYASPSTHSAKPAADSRRATSRTPANDRSCDARNGTLRRSCRTSGCVAQVAPCDRCHSGNHRGATRPGRYCGADG